MVRAMGIPINDGTTIPLHEKTFHVLTIAHMTTNNNKNGNWIYVAVKFSSI